MSGLAGTAIDLVTMISLIEVAGAPVAVSAFLGASAGAVACFLLSKFWAFGDRSPIGPKQVGAFGLVALTTALMVATGVHVLAVMIGMPYLFAKAITSFVVFVSWSYPAQSRLVFRRARRALNSSPPASSPVSVRRPAMYQTPEISIVIPAYNEENRIAPTIEEIDRFLRAARMSYEIVVVDDGSTDDTVGLVLRMAASMPALCCVPSKPNRGKGHAVRVGMLAARGGIRVMCDADGSMPATELPAIVNPIRLGEADVAIGSRYVDGSRSDVKQPFYRRWWSRLANKVVQRALSLPGIRDTQCGFKAFSAEAAERVFRLTKIDGWAFDLEALALAKRMGFSVQECGVVWSDDPNSRINPIRDAINVVREMLTIRGNLRSGAYGALEPATAAASLTGIPAA